MGCRYLLPSAVVVCWQGSYLGPCGEAFALNPHPLFLPVTLPSFLPLSQSSDGKLSLGSIFIVQQKVVVGGRSAPRLRSDACNSVSPRRRPLERWTGRQDVLGRRPHGRRRLRRPCQAGWRRWSEGGCCQGGGATGSGGEFTVPPGRAMVLPLLLSICSQHLKTMQLSISLERNLKLAGCLLHVR